MRSIDSLLKQKSQVREQVLGLITQSFVKICVPFRPEKQSTMLEAKINILSNEKKIRRRKRRIDVKLNGRVKRNYLNNFYIKTFFESLFQNIHEFPCSTETNWTIVQIRYARNSSAMNLCLSHSRDFLRGGCPHASIIIERITRVHRLSFA